jgi:segregation and condensation protein A
MLEAKRYRGAADDLRARLESEDGIRYRSAPPPAWLRRQDLSALEAVYDPRRLGTALVALLTPPPEVSLRHVTIATVTVAERLTHLRSLLRRGATSFDEAVRGADRVTVAVTVWALLELYKRGEAVWEQDEPFGDIAITAVAPAARVEAA